MLDIIFYLIGWAYTILLSMYGRQMYYCNENAWALPNAFSVILTCWCIAGYLCCHPLSAMLTLAREFHPSAIAILLGMAVTGTWFYVTISMCIFMNPLGMALTIFNTGALVACYTIYGKNP